MGFGCHVHSSITVGDFIFFSSLLLYTPHRWCLYLIVAVGFECSRDPEIYAGGSIATGRGTQARQVKG
jgi:hypothetical protein